VHELDANRIIPALLPPGMFVINAAAGNGLGLATCDASFAQWIGQNNSLQLRPR
jgi:hypothetical protein